MAKHISTERRYTIEISERERDLLLNQLHRLNGLATRDGDSLVEFVASLRRLLSAEDRQLSELRQFFADIRER